MPALPAARVRVAVAAMSAAALLTPLVTPTAVADVDGAPTLTQTPAQQALDVAEQVMGGAPAELSPTLALRDLALRQDGLTGTDRDAADALLARPNGGNTRSDFGPAVWPGNEAAASSAGDGCSTVVPVCVHWTNQGEDAPASADRNGDDVPNWVETTVTTMETVWAYEVDTLGYRPPLTDQRASIDDDGVNFDVYLSDIGSRGLYGYCAVDDSRTRSPYRYDDYAGYCVLDNDFARGQFPTNSPIENLRVTAAHEFFHAIQFAYDATEDAWFMEGTAAWIEDEVYDSVNDNRYYLRSSQFKNPGRPLDTSRGFAVYGTWGFFRFLSERFDTDVVRRAWGRADASKVGPNDYSIQALRRAVGAEGADFTKVLGDFGLALAEPKAFLSEGAAFPSAIEQGFTLRRIGTTTRWQRYTLDHLAYAPLQLRPGDQLGGGARLQITVDGPRLSTAPEARVMVVRDNGSFGAVQRVQLNRRGIGSLSVGFAPRDVRHVVLALGNASTDYRRCFSRSSPYSCRGGVPVHDDQRYRFRAVVR